MSSSNVISDAIDLLDRQYNYLKGLSTDKFLVQLAPFLELLRDDAHFGPHIADLVREAEALRRVPVQVDEHLLRPLVAIRLELVGLRPDLDDSTQTPGERSRPNPDWGFTLASFDVAARQSPTPLLFLDERAVGGRASRTSELLRVLQSKLAESSVATSDGPSPSESPIAARPSLAPLRERLAKSQQEYEHARRSFMIKVRTSAAASLARLLDALEELNPRPDHQIPPEQRDASILRHMDAAFRRIDEVRTVVIDRLGRGQEPPSVAAAASRIQPDVACVYEELRRRLGTTLSGAHLIRRFKERCEAFEAQRLRSDAEGSIPHEEPLERELARWLFDQGLNPIRQVTVSGLRPDVVDPFHSRPVYVEAKQYKTKEEVNRARAWYAQVCDTVARIRGTKFEVREAFLVIFRRSGPSLAIEPASTQVGGVTIHVLVVDIAPAEESGSRQTLPPVHISLRDADVGEAPAAPASESATTRITSSSGPADLPSSPSP